MSKNTAILERQNDPQAILYLKASESCLRTERILKYLMIFLSFGICLAAIFNRILPAFIPDVDSAASQLASTYLNLLSGAIIVAGIPVGFYMSRKHAEGTVLRDRYESYIFDNAPNASILRPISKSYIANYAKKIRKTDDKFHNYILSEEDNLNELSAQFDFIVKEIHSDYNLYLWVQPKFIAVWIGFCVFIFVIALSFNGEFIATLINILIPSLSAISTICSSWFSLRLQMRQLNNLINVTDQIQAMSTEKKRQYLSNKENVRLLADGLYNYRSSSFIIPTPLIMLYQWSITRAKKKNAFDPTPEPTIAAYRKSSATKKKTPAAKPTATNKAVAKEVAAAKPQSKPTEAKPQSKPTEAKPQPKPAEAKPQPKPAEAKPQPKPAETKPQPKPTETKPQPKPAEAKPQPKPAEAKPQPKPTEAKPQPKPTDAKPQPKPAEAKPQPKPAEAKPQPKPAEAKPQPKPQPKPADKPKSVKPTESKK